MTETFVDIGENDEVMNSIGQTADDRRSAPSVSVVVPVYNGEMTILPLIERLHPALELLSADYEVIMVNDGSRDGTWPMISELAIRHDWLTGIDLMRNYGQHNALLCGIRIAKYEIIVTLDADLQNPPEEIGNLIAALGTEYDVVYGTPLKEQHGMWRDAASRVTKIALQNVMGAETARNVSAFRAFRQEIIDAFANYRSPSVSIDVLLTWGSGRFTAVKVRHDPRYAGESAYTFRKLATHALNMLTGFTNWPLQLAGLIGFVFTLFGIAILVYVVANYFLNGSAVHGFAFLASIIAIFSGAQLFALGIIGEYLARMHSRTMERPPYAVRQETGAERASTPNLSR